MIKENIVSKKDQMRAVEGLLEECKTISKYLERCLMLLKENTRDKWILWFLLREAVKNNKSDDFKKYLFLLNQYINISFRSKNIINKAHVDEGTLCTGQKKNIST